VTDADLHPDLHPDRHWMDHALDLARQAAAIGEVPVGAVVVLDAGTPGQRPIGEGFNRREIDKSPSAHAEFLAIQRACEAIGDWRLERTTLYVTLEPCAMCAGLIVNARIPRVVFATTDPKGGCAGTLYNLLTDPRLNHRCEVVTGVRRDESATMLTTFFRALRSQ
jgi:tRNA(adenine34) deaminase